MLETVLHAEHAFSPVSPTFIDGENKRRRTLTQLNCGEDRHKLARAVFHGKRGELRQRYREGQEDQWGALGLVVNIIILWNTLYINAALEQLAGEGYSIRSEDVARLSPLICLLERGWVYWCSSTSICSDGMRSQFRIL